MSSKALREYLGTPPEFTLEKLKEVLHYTDLDANPSFDAFQSDCLYEIQSGAKGVSKSFGGAIITIYRIVNDHRFNSIWCRNRYKHIKDTLLPMFKRALEFLAYSHNLDYQPYFHFTEKAGYWNYPDQGEGRAIYFANWENTQSFQGITLPKMSFYWGEFVVDEPIEDPNEYGSTLELRKIYETQEKNLSLILQNTILREKVPEDFKQKIKFFYNIFTSEHFLVRNFHRKVVPFCDEYGAPVESYLSELIENKFIQVEDKDFAHGFGLIVSMFSKFFVKASAISDLQRKNFERLKEENFRLWVITVAGLTYQSENLRENYFLKDLIYKEDGEFADNIKFKDVYDIEQEIQKGKLRGVFFGYDPGKYDNASLVSLLLFEGYAVVWKSFEDIKKVGNETKRKLSIQETHAKLLSLITLISVDIWKLLQKAPSWQPNCTPYDFFVYLDIDSDTEFQFLKEKILEQELPIAINKARRRMTKFGDFSIIGRQEKLKLSLDYSYLTFTNLESSKKLLKNLSKQVIERGEDKRNEEINKEIYDFINALEYALNRAWLMLRDSIRKE